MMLAQPAQIPVQLLHALFVRFGAFAFQALVELFSFAGEWVSRFEL